MRSSKFVAGSSWSLEAYIVHNEALREAEALFHAERDRRYAEVNIEKEKALKIKEEADKAALGLAREIQTYKDEKANELREQIGSERGLYASKSDLIAAVEKLEARLKPLSDFIAREQGKGQGISASWAVLLAVVTLALAAYALATR